MKTIGYSIAATKQLKKLPGNAREDVIAKVRRYAETGAGKFKRLTGRPEMVLRVGNFRVIYTETAEAITVHAVGDRRDVYKG